MIHTALSALRWSSVLGSLGRTLSALGSPSSSELESRSPARNCGDSLTGAPRARTRSAKPGGRRQVRWCMPQIECCIASVRCCLECCASHIVCCMVPACCMSDVARRLLHGVSCHCVLRVACLTLARPLEHSRLKLPAARPSGLTTTPLSV